MKYYWHVTDGEGNIHVVEAENALECALRSILYRIRDVVEMTRVEAIPHDLDEKTRRFVEAVTQ